jgi:hypothetical protein
LRSPSRAYVPFTVLQKGTVTKVEVKYNTLKGKTKVKILYFDCAHFGDVKLVKGFTTFKKN